MGQSEVEVAVDKDVASDIECPAIGSEGITRFDICNGRGCLTGIAATTRRIDYVYTKDCPIG